MNIIFYIRIIKIRIPTWRRVVDVKTCKVYFSKVYDSQDNELTVYYVVLYALITKPKVSHSIPDAKPSSSKENN